MRIVSFERRQDKHRAGLLLAEGRVLDLGRAYTSLQESRPAKPGDTQALLRSLRGLNSRFVDILQGGEESLAECFQLDKLAKEGKLEEFVFDASDAPLRPPIPTPPLLLHFEVHEEHVRKVLQVQRHIDDLPSIWYRYPIYYPGNPYNLLGPEAPVIFPAGETRMDYAMGLACVLAEDVCDATVEEADEAILGYTIVNDWTARDLERELLATGMSVAKAKAFACSIGPAIVTKDELSDPYELAMSVRVNGQLMGEGKAAHGRFKFPEMISYASEGTFLPAGTVICGGAIRSGSGLEHGMYLNAGDLVELEVEQIGILRNRVWDRQHPSIFEPH